MLYAQAPNDPRLVVTGIRLDSAQEFDAIGRVEITEISC